MQSMLRGAWMTLTSAPRRHVTIGGGQMMTCREIAKVGQLILNRCVAARPSARPPSCEPSADSTRSIVQRAAAGVEG